MATTTEKPTAAELRAQRDARVAREQAQMEEARKRAEAEAEAAAEAAAAQNGRGSHVDPKQGLFDQEIDNDELEAALEKREKRNNSRKELVRQFKEADEQAKAILATLGLDDGAVVRCGRFRVEKKVTAGRSVAFETDPSSRLAISLLDD